MAKAEYRSSIRSKNLIKKALAKLIHEKELAKSYGMSYSHFSRSFKKVTGVTFKNYLNRTRISKAEQLLFSKTCSVSEAAIACGYNSISYFIKVYRLFTGTTPYKVLRSGNWSLTKRNGRFLRKSDRSPLQTKLTDKSKFEILYKIKTAEPSLEFVPKLGSAFWFLFLFL